MINAGKFDEAKLFLNEGIALARSLNNDFALGSMLNNLGDLYLKELKFDESIPLFTEGLEQALSIGDPILQCTSLRGLAYCNLDKKKFTKAMEYVNRSLDIAKENDYLKQEEVNYLLISDIQLAMGNTDNYYKFRYKSDSVSAIIGRERIQRNIETLEQQFKAREREHQIEELEKEKVFQKLRYRTGLFILITLVGISFTILIILSMKVRSNRQKRIILEKEKLIQQQRINELEREKQLAASEAVLKGQEEERKRLAKDLHDGLGGMLSGIKYSFSNVKENIIMSPENQRAFERSMDMLDSSISELRRVAHNMMPESLIRFGLEISVRDICRDITNSGALNASFQAFGINELKADQQTQIIIYRIIQELLNNIMKHAAAKNAIVQMTILDNNLNITVEDDGKGFDVKSIDPSKGLGLNNLKSRIEYLGGKLEIESEPGQGTTVNIEIKI
jgi:signal transduction histidine kinase